MSRETALILATVLVLGKGLRAQAPASAALALGDPLYIPYPVSACVDAGDTVGLVLSYPSLDSTVVMAFRFEEGVLWATSIRPAAATYFQSTRVLRRANGETLVLGVLLHDAQPLRHALIRLDADGALQSATALVVPGTSVEDGDYGSSALHELPGHGLLLSLAFGHKPVVVLLADDGSVTWARSFITIDPTTKNPSFDFAVLANGDVLLTNKAEEDPFLVRVSPYGEVQWAARYANGLYTHTKTALELSNGDIAIAGYQGNDAFAARIDAGGGIIWWRAISTQESFFGGFKRIAELADGSLLLGSEAPESSGDLYAGAVLLRPNGEALQAWATTPTIYSGLSLAGLSGEQAVLVGLALYADPDEQTTADLRLMRLDLRTTGHCDIVDDTAWSIPVSTPPQVTNGVQVTEETVVPMEAPMIAQPLGWSASESCGLTLRLPAARVVPGLRITPSLAAAGSLVQVEAREGMAELRVLDAAGRVVGNQPGKSANPSLLRMDVPAGAYLIQAVDARGQQVGIARIVVQ